MTRAAEVIAIELKKCPRCEESLPVVRHGDRRCGHRSSAFARLAAIDANRLRKRLAAVDRADGEDLATRLLAAFAPRDERVARAVDREPRRAALAHVRRDLAVAPGAAVLDPRDEQVLSRRPRSGGVVSMRALSKLRVGSHGLCPRVSAILTRT